MCRLHFISNLSLSSGLNGSLQNRKKKHTTECVKMGKRVMPAINGSRLSNRTFPLSSFLLYLWTEKNPTQLKCFGYNRRNSHFSLRAAESALCFQHESEREKKHICTTKVNQTDEGQLGYFVNKWQTTFRINKSILKTGRGSQTAAAVDTPPSKQWAANGGCSHVDGPDFHTPRSWSRLLTPQVHTHSS